MFGISFAELMIIFLLVLIVMGPEKLPEVARWAGKGLRELRRASNTLRSALTLEDFDTPRNSPRQLDRKASLDPGSSTSTGEEVEPTPSRPLPPDYKEGEHPAYARPRLDPSAGSIDQVDDDDFQAMLEQEYRHRHDETRSVSLRPRRPTDETFAVALEVARPCAELQAVPILVGGGRW